MKAWAAPLIAVLLLVSCRKERVSTATYEVSCVRCYVMVNSGSYTGTSVTLGAAGNTTPRAWSLTLDVPDTEPIALMVTMHPQAQDEPTARLTVDGTLVASATLSSTNRLVVLKP